MENGWASNAQRIDQAPKVRSCDVIMTPSVQPAVVNFLWSAQTYSINFVNSFMLFIFQNRSGIFLRPNKQLIE